MKPTKVAQNSMAQLMPCGWLVGFAAEAHYHFNEAEKGCDTYLIHGYV